jgi:hypothetical protein
MSGRTGLSLALEPCMTSIRINDPLRLRTTGGAVDVGKGSSDNPIWRAVHGDSVARKAL